MKPSHLWALARQAGRSWVDDYAQSMGAALAYYTLFSIAPLLLIVVSVAGLMFGEEAARGQIFGQLRGLMGEQGAAAVQGLLQSVDKPAAGVLGALVGIAMTLIGAMAVFGELQNALDRIWRAPALARSSGLWTLVRSRLLSFGMILGIGFLLVVTLVASAAAAALTRWGTPRIGGWTVLAAGIDFLLSFVLTTATFALIYKIMPRVRVQWRDVWIGATATALLFAVGKVLVGLYIGTGTFASGFGAAASLVVLLLWTYYSAQIFLLGAEFTWVYAHVHGSRRSAPAPGVPPEVPSQGAAGAAWQSATSVEDALARSRAAILAAAAKPRR